MASPRASPARPARWPSTTERLRQRPREGDTELGVAVDPPEGRDAIQRDPEKEPGPCEPPEVQRGRAQGPAAGSVSVRTRGMKGRRAEKDLGLPVNEKPGKPPGSWAAVEEAWPAGRGRPCFPLCSAESPPGTLMPPAFRRTRRTWTRWSESGGGRGDGGRAGAALLGELGLV